MLAVDKAHRDARTAMKLAKTASSKSEILSKQKIAVTSSTPGRTQQLNFFSIDSEDPNLRSVGVTPGTLGADTELADASLEGEPGAEGAPAPEGMPGGALATPGPNPSTPA